MGAMENTGLYIHTHTHTYIHKHTFIHTGLVTYSEGYVFRDQVTDNERAERADTILHEMAHMYVQYGLLFMWGHLTARLYNTCSVICVYYL